MADELPPPSDEHTHPAEHQDLPPLSIGDILRTSLGIFRGRWALFASLPPLALVPSALLAIVAALMSAVLRLVLGTPAAVQFASDAVKDALSTSALLVTLIVIPYVSGAAAVLVTAALLDRDCPLGTAVLIALRRLSASLPTVLMWAGLQFALLAAPAGLRLLSPPNPEVSPTVLGALRLATAAVRILHLWLAVRLIAFPAVLVVENAVLGRAFGRSYQLTAGRWWHSFAVAACALVLSALLCWAVMVPVASILGVGLGSQEVRSLIALCVLALLTFLSQGWYMVVLSLLYIDLRARTEGLNTAQLQRELLAAGLPSSPSDPPHDRHLP